MSCQLKATNIKKVFNRRVIFRNISFALSEGQTLRVTGRNGSGKSTLVKIISRVLSPTEGSVEYAGMEKASEAGRLQVIGLVSPYLQLYDEFSARENLQFAMAIRGENPDTNAISALLDMVSLSARKDDPVRTYSSGMKQRAKYALALVHHPPVLILDEPMANLDADGTSMVRDIMERQREHGLLIVATNDASDLDRFDLEVNLNDAR